MKIAVLCSLLIPIWVLALKQKKWYLYTLMAFAGILPEQFAIEIHEKIPLLSGTRILILIVIAFWLYHKVRTRTFTVPKSLMFFLGANVLISVIDMRLGTSELNRIALLVFERVLLVMAVTDLVESKEEFHRCIDFMILSSMALAVIGIMQTVLEFDVAPLLRIAAARTNAELTSRMSMVRASGTFNAISYSSYCAIMELLIYYRLDSTKQHRYSVAFALNATVLVCTMSRSGWLCMLGIFFLLLVIYRMRFIRRMVPGVLLTIVLLASLFAVQNNLCVAVVETTKSTINTVISAVIPDEILGSNIPATPPADSTDPTAESPVPSKPGHPLLFEISEEFGLNGEDPAGSRMVEWTAVEYMIKDGYGLFGYGYRAFLLGKLHYAYNRAVGWTVATTIDVGLVKLATEYGLAGLATLLIWLCYLFGYAFNHQKKGQDFDFYKATMLMIILYVLVNFLSGFLDETAAWLVFGLIYAYQRLDRVGLIAREAPVAEPEKWTF